MLLGAGTLMRWKQASSMNVNNDTAIDLDDDNANSSQHQENYSEGKGSIGITGVSSKTPLGYHVRAKAKMPQVYGGGHSKHPSRACLWSQTRFTSPLSSILYWLLSKTS